MKTADNVLLKVANFAHVFVIYIHTKFHMSRPEG
jgi:hypothetical protein